MNAPLSSSTPKERERNGELDPGLDCCKVIGKLTFETYIGNGFIWVLTRAQAIDLIMKSYKRLSGNMHLRGVKSGHSKQHVAFDFFKAKENFMDIAN